MRFCLAVIAVKLSRLPIPSRALRVRLFRNVYARMYPPGLNEREAEKPLGSYRSLNAVFTRGVKPEYRPIPADTSELLSPCDGTVQDIGTVERGRILTVKGIPYLLASLLPDIDINPYEGGQFAIIFLSPIDCHRVFSPQDGWLEEIVHVPGARLLVHPPFQRAEFPVYTLNERVIFRLSTDVGSCLVVMVAGWGVGNITLPAAANSQFRRRHGRSADRELPHSVKRGDWIATFELGSSVVLITSSSLCTTPLVSPMRRFTMGSPSLDSPPTTTYSSRQEGASDDRQAIEQQRRATATEIVLIVGFRDALAADYAAYVNQYSENTAVLMVGDEKIRRLVESPVRSLAMDEFLCTTPETWCKEKRVAGVILFINSRLRECERQELDVFLKLARQWHHGFMGIISTFRLHLDDPRIRELENQVVSRAGELSDRLVVFRPGHVLSRHSSMSRLLERFAPMYPLVPERLGSCFIDGMKLFAAIETKRLGAVQSGLGLVGLRPNTEQTRLPRSEGRPVGGKIRAFTFLGPNEPWRALLSRHRKARPRPSVTTAASQILSWLCVGQLLALVLTMLAKGFPWWRQWIVHTLEPRSMRELLSLCHAGNVDHVKVVGYNNGVVHFGHRHPGKTIISTIRCRRTVHAGPQMLKADCGATVRTALDYLGNREELYVVPNYSYVCLGTSFFVPIHGSAVDYSTVADTICRVVLFDPDSDRIFSAMRHDVAFREHVYNLHSRAVFFGYTS